MFGLRKKNNADDDGLLDGDASEVDDSEQNDAQAPKGHATPKRSDHTKHRVYERPPTSRKEASKLQRQRRSEMRQTVKAGMDRGDDKFMLSRDRGPARAYARDVVDSRLNVGTLLMPMALVVLITMFAGIGNIYAVLNTVWLGLMIMAAIDWTITNVKVQRAVKSRYPDDKRGIGLVWYVIQRSIIPRRWRQPKAQVAIGTRMD